MEINEETKFMLDNMSMYDELNILEYIFNKYNMSTVSEYANANKISRQAIYNRIVKGSIMSIKLKEQLFIINLL